MTVVTLTPILKVGRGAGPGSRKGAVEMVFWVMMAVAMAVAAVQMRGGWKTQTVAV